MNKTINLKYIMDEGVNLFKKEYQNLVINYINYMNQKNIQKLDTLFSFSNINNTINKEINNTKLLEVLKKLQYIIQVMMELLIMIYQKTF